VGQSIRLPGVKAKAEAPKVEVPAVQAAPVKVEAPKAASFAKPTTHTVESGDTLSGIARKYGITVRELQQANGGAGKLKTLRIGQKLALPGAVEGEEATAVHTLSTCEDGIQICTVVYNEVQCLQTAIASRVHEIYHAYLILLNETDDVGLGEFLARFAQISDKFIWVEFDFFFHRLNVLVNAHCAFFRCKDSDLPNSTYCFGQNLFFRIYIWL
jgi:LysM repeat protein